MQQLSSQMNRNKFQHPDKNAGSAVTDSADLSIILTDMDTKKGGENKT